MSRVAADVSMHGALKAGARGFLLKDAGPELLAQAMRSAANGDALIAPSVTVRARARTTAATRCLPLFDNRMPEPEGRCRRDILD